MPYGRRFGRRSFSRNRSAQGQGRMRAENSGTTPLIRHSVTTLGIAGGPLGVADGKAIALPLVVYYGTSAEVDGVSSSPSISKNSRVNHIGANLVITQSDTAKPNQCYVGIIATSFSEGMLNAANMTSNFADLIAASNETTGLMNTYNGVKSLTYKDWSQSAVLRHNIRGFQRNNYTLYSGRPAQLKTTLRVPGKCKRGQFGMGYWLVILNDSASIQSESASGDGTDINVGLDTFFKEIPATSTAQT